eukprot:gene3519-6166_t
MEALSQQQIKEFKDLFKFFDKDEDGKISKLDLETVMKEVGLRPTSNQIREMMEECDPTATGYIPFNEFLAVLASKLRNTSRSEHLLQAFQSFDPEGKGYIPASELKKNLMSWGNPLNDNEWKEMLREINCSESDLFEYKKFVASMTNTSQDESNGQE